MWIFHDFLKQIRIRNANWLITISNFHDIMQELRAALEEHQSALELIMSKYREHVTRWNCLYNYKIYVYDAKIISPPFVRCIKGAGEK